MNESEVILNMWARVWPKKFFKTEQDWLDYCRKWSAQLHKAEEKYK